ncbi:MAG: NUDIX hydrolase [Acidimicrobiales bacterium]
MRDWLVGGALVVGPEGVLLVQNRRPNGRLDWSPPGGVIDEGESLLEGLTREVAEETGINVIKWRGPIYEIEAIAPGLGWRLRVEAHLAVDFGGDLALGDPDGIVIEAGYVPLVDAHDRLGGAPRWVREPFGEWLSEPWRGCRRFGYHIEGVDHRGLEVVRV